MGLFRNLYRGWFVLAAGYVCGGLLIACTIYSFGLFVKPVAAEFGLSRADANNGFIIFTLGTSLSLPFIGRLLDRMPLQRVTVTGSIVFAIAFVGLGLAPSLWMMVPLLLLAAIGMAGAGALAANKAAASWFHRRRGRVLGFLATATSAGGTVVAPSMAWLIENHGWRMALIVAGIVAGTICAVLSALFMRNRTGDWDPVERESVEAAPPADEPVWRVPDLLRARNFWLIAFSMGTMLAVDQALLASLVAYSTDRGMTLAQAGFLMSVLAASAIAGKLLVGLAAERFDQRVLMAAVAASHLVFLSVLLSDPSYPLLIGIASVAGLAVGGTYPIWNLVVAICFGSASFGSVIGAMSPISLPLSMVAARFIGEVYDRTHRYDFAFQTFLVLAVISAILILFVRPPRRDRIDFRSAGPAVAGSVAE